MLRFIFTIAILFTMAPQLPAQYRNGYCPPSYSYGSPRYSEWVYRAFPGTNYYYRVRTVIDGNSQSVQNDGWLYSFNGGTYSQFQSLDDYHSGKVGPSLLPNGKFNQLGNAAYGDNSLGNILSKLLGPQIGSVLQPQYPPAALNAGSFLPTLERLASARLEAASKGQNAAISTFGAVVQADVQRERENDAARNLIAREVIKQQGFERAMRAYSEATAIAEGTAVGGAPQIDVGDPQLSQIIAANCLSCHGGAKVDAGLDFKLAATFTPKQWRRIVSMVDSGVMPKQGTRLDDAAVDLFEAAEDRAKASVGRIQ